jgi:ATP-dependent exoDNAse (exonuclease V) alpha subunit
MDNGTDITFDPREMRHFDHGYAVTSHSSQGLTSERVLVNVDTDVHPQLINSRFAYVAVSRASNEVQIYTNDGSNLAERLSLDVSKTSALQSIGSIAEQVQGKLKSIPNALGLSL